MDRNPGAVKAIRAEGLYCHNSKARVRAAEDALGFPIVMNTVDAVMVMSGHVLLMRRDALPGKGTLALPGGHILKDKTAQDSIFDILRNKARLDTPRGGLLANRLCDRKVFDHPERSERGWIRTEAFYFEFEDRPKLEKKSSRPRARPCLSGCQSPTSPQTRCSKITSTSCRVSFRSFPTTMPRS